VKLEKVESALTEKGKRLRLRGGGRGFQGEEKRRGGWRCLGERGNICQSRKQKEGGLGEVWVY